MLEGCQTCMPNAASVGCSVSGTSGVFWGNHQVQMGTGSQKMVYSGSARETKGGMKKSGLIKKQRPYCIQIKILIGNKN